MSRPLESKVSGALERAFTDLQDSYRIQMNLDLLVLGELPTTWYDKDELLGDHAFFADQAPRE